MLSVYADESTDQNKERVFAIAGVIGTQEEWDELEAKWLKRTNGVPFHATDCESGWGVYRGISREERRLLYKDLTIMLADSRMMGVGTALDLADFRKVMADPSEDAPYFFCFRNTIIHLVLLTKHYFPKQTTVKFTFDINEEVQYNAAFLYNRYMARRLEYPGLISYMEKEISFASREVVGIQVADLFAFETMKRIDNLIGPVKRPTRLSLQVLEKTKRFKPHCYTESYFEFLRRYYGSQKIATDNKAYKAWLSANNCLDNTENRTRYVIYMDDMKKLRGE